MPGLPPYLTRKMLSASQAPQEFENDLSLVLEAMLFISSILKATYHRASCVAGKEALEQEEAAQALQTPEAACHMLPPDLMRCQPLLRHIPML